MVVGTEQMAVPFRIYATPESSNNPTFPPDTDPSLCVSGDILRSRLVSANRERRMDAWVTGCARPLVAASDQAAEMSAESRTILVNGRDRNSVVWGQRVSVRVDHGGRRNYIQK